VTSLGISLPVDPSSANDLITHDRLHVAAKPPGRGLAACAASGIRLKLEDAQHPQPVFVVQADLHPAQRLPARQRTCRRRRQPGDVLTPAGADLAGADVPDRPAPTLVDVGRWDAPLVREWMPPDRQRPALQLDLHGLLALDGLGAAQFGRNPDLLDRHRVAPTSCPGRQSPSCRPTCRPYSPR